MKTLRWIIPSLLIMLLTACVASTPPVEQPADISGVDAVETPPPSSVDIEATETEMTEVTPIITEPAHNQADPAPSPLSEATQTGAASATSPSQAVSEPPPAPLWAQTNLRADGNRVVAGNGLLPGIQPLDIPLPSEPVWVVGLPYQAGALWVSALSDGRLLAFSVINGVVKEYPISPAEIPPGMPPLVVLEEEQLRVVLPDGPFSPRTHPVLINDTEQLAYIDDQGGLIIVERDGGTQRLEINAQPDARILVDENGRLLIHTDPTDRYAHAIMGDNLEAAGLVLVETDPEPAIIRTIPIPDTFVIEGISPIWADLNGDGTREIIITRANREQGAQIVVLDEFGTLIAEGDPIGTGNRWRHQLAVAPFGPAGELELVDVLTPHIGGPAEFFRWEGERLIKITQERGYTSHVILSPNLDMAVAGRLDETGRMTLLIPTQDRTILGGIQHLDGGAETVWTLPLEGKLVTNIAAVHLSDGSIGIAVGLESGQLRLWQ